MSVDETTFMFPGNARTKDTRTKSKLYALLFTPYFSSLIDPFINRCQYKEWVYETLQLSANSDIYLINSYMRRMKALSKQKLEGSEDA